MWKDQTLLKVLDWPLFSQVYPEACIMRAFLFKRNYVGLKEQKIKCLKQNERTEQTSAILSFSGLTSNCGGKKWTFKPVTGFPTLSQHFIFPTHCL